MNRIVKSGIASLLVVCTGCGLEGPAAEQVILGLTAVGATAAVVSATADVAEASEENRQSEILRHTEDIRRMTTEDRQLFDRLEGEWTFIDPMDGIAKGYMFEFNGGLKQFNAEGRMITANGDYLVDDGRVIIRWSSKSKEVATVSYVSDGVFNYEIIDHTDSPQIGLCMCFTKSR